MVDGELEYMYRVVAPALWAPGTVVHYSTASASYDGTYLYADTEDGLRSIMAAIGIHGEIDEYVVGSEEDHVPPPPPPVEEAHWAPAPDEGPAHQPLEG